MALSSLVPAVTLFGIPLRYLLVAVGVAVFTAAMLVRAYLRNVEHAVDASADTRSVPVHPGQEDHVRVRVHNTSDRPVDVALDVEDVPSGWRIGFNLDRFELDAGSEDEVWLSVAVPEDAPAGTRQEFVVTARNVEARFGVQRLDMVADVAAPKSSS